MLGRLGFTGRVMAILFLAMLVLLTVGTAVSYMSARQERAGGQRVLLPERAGAIVAILEHTKSPAGRDLVLKAVNSETLAVTLTPERPFSVPAEERMKAVEWLVGQYMGGTPGREVIAYVEKDERPRWRQLRIANLWLASRKPLRIAVEMRPSGWTVFETRGDISPRVFGLPPGFAVGLVGALVGIAALLAIAREARPLRELAQSVSRFAGAANPEPVTPRGAPEVKSLIAAVNDMQARIAALLKGRTVLLGAISHDLKTFLTRLRLRVESISDPAQQEKAIRDLDDMTDLIDNALAVARGNSGSERRERLDLAAVAAADIGDRDAGAVSLDSAASVPVRGDAVGTQARGGQSGGQRLALRQAGEGERVAAGGRGAAAGGRRRAGHPGGRPAGRAGALLPARPLAQPRHGGQRAGARHRQADPRRA